MRPGSEPGLGLRVRQLPVDVQTLVVSFLPPLLLNALTVLHRRRVREQCVCGSDSFELVEQPPGRGCPSDLLVYLYSAVRKGCEDVVWPSITAQSFLNGAACRFGKCLLEFENGNCCPVVLVITPLGAMAALNAALDAEEEEWEVPLDSSYDPYVHRHLHRMGDHLVAAEGGFFYRCDVAATRTAPFMYGIEGGANEDVYICGVLTSSDVLVEHLVHWMIALFANHPTRRQSLRELRIEVSASVGTLDELTDPPHSAAESSEDWLIRRDQAGAWDTFRQRYDFHRRQGV